MPEHTDGFWATFDDALEIAHARDALRLAQEALEAVRQLRRRLNGDQAFPECINVSSRLSLIAIPMEDVIRPGDLSAAATA